jgi:hypothetical protein
MNLYAAERLTQERTTEFQAQAARRKPAGSAARTIKRRAGWALIQIGLALVTSSAWGAQRAVSPELP